MFTEYLQWLFLTIVTQFKSVFRTLLNIVYPSTNFAKCSILDIWQGSGHDLQSQVLLSFHFNIFWRNFLDSIHWMKKVQIRGFSGSFFSSFGLPFNDMLKVGLSPSKTNQISLSDFLYFLRYWTICVLEFACFLGCDVINFEINLILLIEPFFYIIRNSRQIFKYLENEKSF